MRYITDSMYIDVPTDLSIVICIATAYLLFHAEMANRVTRLKMTCTYFKVLISDHVALILLSIWK